MYDYLHQSKKELSNKDFVVIHNMCKASVQNLKRAESEVIKSLQQVDKFKVYRHLGHNSLFQYALALNLSESQAYNYIVVARKSIECPALQKAIENKEITISKARTITSVMNSRTQHQWIELARTKSKRELEREVVKLSPRAVNKESARFINDHMLELQIPVSEDIFKKLERVKDLLSQKCQRPVNFEEMLDLLSDEFLKRNDPILKAKSKLATKTRKPVPGQPSIQGQNKKLQIKRRTIPQQTLDAIHLRDKGQCQFRRKDSLICGQSRWIEIHHIRPVSLGGSNELNNLITLCEGHHKVVHEVGRIAPS